MNSHKLEKYAACLLIAVLSMVLGMQHAFASPTPEGSNVGAPLDEPTPTCAC